jgi:hypothetical protein
LFFENVSATRRSLRLAMNFDFEAPFAGRPVRSVRPKKKVAGRIDRDFLAAPNQNRSPLRLQSGDQCSGKRIRKGKTLGGTSAHTLRIAFTARGDIEDIASLKINTSVRPRLSG